MHIIAMKWNNWIAVAKVKIAVVSIAVDTKELLTLHTYAHIFMVA